MSTLQHVAKQQQQQQENTGLVHAHIHVYKTHTIKVHTVISSFTHDPRLSA